MVIDKDRHVSVFGRRTTKDESTDQQVEEQTADRSGGKGRPTPSRKEAEAARKKRNTPPRTRKEAAAFQRERTKENRARQKSAMDGSGLARDLPPRDQGPVKAFIRDWVDSRFTVGQFLLPFMFAMFALTLVRTPWAQSLSSSLFLGLILLLVVDAYRLSRGVKKGIIERFGKDKTKGATMYMLLRAWQMRRLRLPKPRVSLGDKI